jgi:hypothetical protein
MPSITSEPDPVYWRLLKVNPSKNNSSSEDNGQLKYGDAVRLCWRFSDQSSGWRDYYDDFYGRRRFDKPAELKGHENGLYLKAPFPRFEALSSPQGMTMVMSTASTTNPVLQTMYLRDTTKLIGIEEVAFNLFDLTFRLDYVGNDGNGEFGDYMNILKSEDSYTIQTDLVHTTVVSKKQTFGDMADRARTNLLNSYSSQFDKTVDTFSKGSPWDVVREVSKSAAM